MFLKVPLCHWAASTSRPYAGICHLPSKSYLIEIFIEWIDSTDIQFFLYNSFWGALILPLLYTFVTDTVLYEVMVISGEICLFLIKLDLQPCIRVFDSSFQEAYIKRNFDCYVDFLDEVPSASQIKKDAHALYGALPSACHSSVGGRMLMENRDKQVGIRSWYQLVQKYETDQNRYVKIKRLESVMNTVLNCNYKG
jgi:hypothetical protein